MRVFNLQGLAGISDRRNVDPEGGVSIVLNGGVNIVKRGVNAGCALLIEVDMGRWGHIAAHANGMIT